MVPTIYPLETLHNSLSLRQVNEFLTGVCRSCSESHVQSTSGTAQVALSLERQGAFYILVFYILRTDQPDRTGDKCSPWSLCQSVLAQE